jgi:hypothetical protein
VEVVVSPFDFDPDMVPLALELDTNLGRAWIIDLDVEAGSRGGGL